MNNSEIQLWKKYKKTSDQKSREVLIIQYLPLVKYAAGKVITKLPLNIEYGDLVSYGIFGLLDAIEKFNIVKDIKFKTYALIRIRGAIYDELRKMDWVPRHIQDKIKEFELTITELENKLGRKVTNKEIINYNKINTYNYYKFKAYNHQSIIKSLDSISNKVNNSLNTLRPDYLYEKKEIKEIITAAIIKLSEQHRKVILLYYYENLTLKEIGKTFNMTIAQAFRLLTKAKQYLRVTLKKYKIKEYLDAI